MKEMRALLRTACQQLWRQEELDEDAGSQGELWQRREEGGSRTDAPEEVMWEAEP